MILLRELVVIDAVDHGEIGAGARRGDQHALGAGFEMLGRCLPLGESARAFHDDVDIHLTPRKIGGRGLRQHGEVLSVDLEVAVGHIDLARESSMHAVILKQKGIRLGRAEVVDRHEIEVLAARFQESPQGEPADPAESIDGDARISHVLAYLYFLTIRSRAAVATASGVMPKCL